MLRKTMTTAVVAIAAATVLAACGGDGGGTAPAALAPDATVSASPEASTEVTTEARRPPPPPVTSYQYAPDKGGDLCLKLVNYPPLLGLHDRVERVNVPASPLECPLDLRSGAAAHLLDIKVQLDQSNASIYVWRNLDAAMGQLNVVEGLGQYSYFFDSDLGRTLVVRDATLVARILLMPNVNTDKAPVTAEQHLLLLSVAQHLMAELRVPL
jgi:hypothetical protein